MVVTPGALGPCQLQTGQRKLRWVPIWHQVHCRRAQGHPVSVSSVHPVETQQGPGWPACHMNMSGAKDGIGLVATELASLMLTVVPPFEHKAGRRRQAAQIPKPGLGPGEPIPVGSCLMAMDQSSHFLPWLPGTQFHKHLRPLSLGMRYRAEGYAEILGREFYLP